MDVEKACKLATDERTEPYVEQITDIGHSFVIATLSAGGLSADVWPCMVNKKTGAVSDCFVPEHFKELKKGKNIPVPAKFRFA